MFNKQLIIAAGLLMVFCGASARENPPAAITTDLNFDAETNRHIEISNEAMTSFDVVQ